MTDGRESDWLRQLPDFRSNDSVWSGFKSIHSSGTERRFFRRISDKVTCRRSPCASRCIAGCSAGACRRTPQSLPNQTARLCRERLHHLGLHSCPRGGCQRGRRLIIRVSHRLSEIGQRVEDRSAPSPICRNRSSQLENKKALPAGAERAYDSGSQRDQGCSAFKR